MSSFDDDVDIFDFDDRMDTEAQPITIDSDDSFEDGPVKTSFLLDPKSIVERYQAMKEESKHLDEVAREVRSLMLICRQMEECYSKRVNRKDPVITSSEIRHLHDGTALLLIKIHNITDQLFSDWSLSISASPVFPCSLAGTSQSIPLGILRPDAQKTFECHVAHQEPPILLQMSLIREFELEEIRKVFQVEVDPILVTIWDEMQVVKEPRTMNTSFTSSIRLPNPLIDLLAGCPDTIPTASSIFKAILNLDVASESSEVVLLFDSLNALVKVSAAKNGASHHILKMETESSRSHAVLSEHLRLRLIVEMSKLKARPRKGKEGSSSGISILAEMTAATVEELFQSMLAGFH